MNRTSILVAAIGLLGACGGAYRGGTTMAKPPADGDGEGEAVRGVAAAALPYAIVDGHSGRAVPEAEFWAALGRARAVCAGEEHPNPHHHWAQLAIVEHLGGPVAPPGAGAPAGVAVGDGRFALGLEMIQRTFQGVVTDYQDGIIDEAAFLSRTGWSDRWGFDFGLYRPMLERARAVGWTLLALNAPRELVKRVGKVGVAGLDVGERAQLPPVVLDDARHRAWFEGVMAGMGGGHGHGDGHGELAPDAHAPGADAKPEEPPAPGGGKPAPPDAKPMGPPPAAMPSMDNVYAAQVVWDESMAEAAWRWLERGTRIVILAGNGHCHDSAIVGRLKRRGVAAVVSVRPIIDDGEGNVAAALAEAMNDYLFVMTMPAGAPE